MVQDVKPGDLVGICFSYPSKIRQLFHYGIVAHDTRYVYHFDVKKSLNFGIPFLNKNQKNIFRKTGWKKFVDGAKASVYILEVEGDCAEIVLERAKLLERLELKNYDILNTNCEHVALWCKQGRWYSSQVKLETAIPDFVLERILHLMNPKLQSSFRKWIINLIKNSKNLPPKINSFLNKNPISFKRVTALLTNNLDSSDYGDETYLNNFTFLNYSDGELRINQLPDNVQEIYQEYKQNLQEIYQEYKNIEQRRRIVGVMFIGLLLSLLFILQQCGVIKPVNQTHNEPATTIPRSSPTETNDYSLYTVKEKDTLTSISKHCYGDGSKLDKIKEANSSKLKKGSDHIEPGWKLKISGGCQGDSGEK